MGRSIWAIVFGLIVAIAWIFTLELVNRLVFPQLADVNLEDREAVGRVFVDNPGMLLGLDLVYFISTFVGAWLGGRTAKRNHIVHGLIIGLLLFCTGIMNLQRFPHPIWFWIVCLATFPLAALLGGWVASKNEVKPSPSLT
ncbi:MAG TPA: YrzE family protein [Gemmataceae bacterium]|jgi:hypothetical protein|nr:YrzE family protein [Gemmataceae bacterium]